MSREREHRALRLRAMRQGFLEGWRAGRRAVGNKAAPQRADAAWEIVSERYLRREPPLISTSVDASGATERS